jgi:hypothetical protein
LQTVALNHATLSSSGEGLVLIAFEQAVPSSQIFARTISGSERVKRNWNRHARRLAVSDAALILTAVALAGRGNRPRLRANEHIRDGGRIRRKWQACCAPPSVLSARTSRWPWRVCDDHRLLPPARVTDAHAQFLTLSPVMMTADRFGALALGPAPIVARAWGSSLSCAY